MNHTKSLSQGENLKRLRKLYRFKQNEITGEHITRNLISLIENNKTPLNEKTAKILAENMNKLAKARNINFFFEPEDLLYPERYEAKKSVYSQIEDLKKFTHLDILNLETKLKSIESYFIKWDLPYEKFITYETVGDLYFKEKQYEKSYIFYIKAFENGSKLSNIDSIGAIILKLTRCSFKLNKFEEVINFSNLINTFSHKISNNILAGILFNRALAFKYLKLYDKSLNCIKKLEDIIDSSNLLRYSDLLILKASCLKSKKNYDEALKILYSLIDKLNENYIENKMLTYLNILDIYCSMNSKKNIQIILNELSEMTAFFQNPSAYEPDFYYQVALAYKQLNDYSLAESHFIKALNSSKKYNELIVYIDSLSQLLNLYISLNAIEKIESFKNELLNLFCSNLLNDNKLIFQLIKFYNDNNLNAKINEILKTILNN